MMARPEAGSTSSTPAGSSATPYADRRRGGSSGATFRGTAAEGGGIIPFRALATAHFAHHPFPFWRPGVSSRTAAGILARALDRRETFRNDSRSRHH